METAKPTILVTGVSGNLGRRLLQQLSGYTVVGVDIAPPPESQLSTVLSRSTSGARNPAHQLNLLIRELQPVSVVHLAFVIDPQRTGVLDVDRMWQINVAGTARVMEAISEANRVARSPNTMVRQFIVPSSVSVYGPDLTEAVTEDAPLLAHTLPYAVHKKESDLVVQHRAPSLRNCGVFLLRPHIFAGATVENYLMGAFRGTPNGKGARAARMRKAGKRLPCMLPYGRQYLENQLQFIHVDDMARLIAWILQARTGSAAADDSECRRPRRGDDLRPMHPARASQADSRSRPMDDAPDSALPVELEYLSHPAGRRPLHERPIHHEHRPPEEFPGPATTTR